MPPGLLRDCPEYYRDCNYLLAEAHFQLGHYTEARTYNDALLALEPHNQQARRLHEQIARQLTQGQAACAHAMAHRPPPLTVAACSLC